MTYTKFITSVDTGWTLARLRWQLDFVCMEAVNFAVYPFPILTYGFVALQGNPPPAPLTPNFGAGLDQDWVWLEGIRYDRFDTIHGSTVFTINHAPHDGLQRDSKAMRRNTDVRQDLTLVADYAPSDLGGPPFAVTGLVEALYLEP